MTHPITKDDYFEEFNYFVRRLLRQQQGQPPITHVDHIVSVDDRLVYGMHFRQSLTSTNVSKPELRRTSQDVIDACYVVATCNHPNTRLDVEQLLEAFASDTAKAAVMQYQERRRRIETESLAK